MEAELSIPWEQIKFDDRIDTCHHTDAETGKVLMLGYEQEAVERAFRQAEFISEQEQKQVLDEGRNFRISVDSGGVL